jgi:UDP-N-acetylglucosamine/UDP-N-acetyl-alpha-D-glucosaminouronate 4-epimerase
MALCLVTGGAGFLGSHLVEALVGRRHRVRVLDDLSTGRRANLAAVQDGIEFIEGHVCDRSTVRAAVRGVDAVFHLAAPSASLEAVSDPVEIHHACGTATLQLLHAAHEAQVRRVVYAGTAAVYRDEDDRPREESDPTLPRSIHATAKLAAEHYCVAFSQTHGLETVRLRFFNVFGPRQPSESPHASVVSRFIQRMRRGQNPLVFGDGYQMRDFTSVEDVVQANLLAMDAPRVAGKVYNIASGQAVTLLTLIKVLNGVLGTRLIPSLAASRRDEPRHQVANIHRAQKELGFCPCTDLARDLRRCLDEPAASPPPLLENTPPQSGLVYHRTDGPSSWLGNAPHRARDWLVREP